MMMRNYIPEKKGFWKNKYVTYRRLWLDACLSAFLNEVHGLVIDLGGKRENKRGSFQPPESQVEAWWYINLDPEADPNIFSDVTQTPLMLLEHTIFKRVARGLCCYDLLGFIRND